MTGWRRGAVNILLINQYAGSPVMGMEHRPFELARAWQAMGDSPVVLLGDRSHLRRQNPALPRSGHCWQEEGVRFCGLKTSDYASNGLDRARNVAGFCAALVGRAGWLAETFAPDVVIASSTHPFDFAGARRIAQKSGALLLFELHDLWPLSPMELYGYSKAHPLMQLIEQAERRAVERADGVVSLLPGGRHWFDEQGWRLKSYRHIPNGFAPRAEQMPPAGHLQRLDALALGRRGLVVYAGGFSEANAVEDFARLAGLLPEVGFAAIGEGPLWAELAHRYAGQENLAVLPAVEGGCLPALLRRADLLWLGTRDLTIYRYGLAMNKLFDYLLAGRPVMLAAPGGGDPVSLSGAGAVAPPGDLLAQRAQLLALLALTPQQRDRMGERGRRYVLEHHDYRRLASDFKRYMEDLRYESFRPAP